MTRLDYPLRSRPRRMLARMLASAPLLLLPLSAPCQDAVPSHDFHMQPGFRWPLTAEQADRITVGEVHRLIDFTDEATGGKTYDLGTYTFVRMDENELELLAAVDTSGQGFLDAIDVFRRLQGGIRETTIRSEHPIVVSELVVQVPGSERHLLLARHPVFYRGPAGTKPIYRYELYGMRDGLLEEVSRENVAIFESRVLPEMQAHNQQAVERYAASTEERLEAQREQQCATLEMRSRVYGDSAPALRQALAWAGSGEPASALLGVQLLEVLRSKDAQAALEHLSQSVDPLLRGASEEALGRRKMAER